MVRTCESDGDAFVLHYLPIDDCILSYTYLIHGQTCCGFPQIASGTLARPMPPWKSAWNWLVQKRWNFLDEEVPVPLNKSEREKQFRRYNLK
jgi:hypothetical protein